MKRLQKVIDPNRRFKIDETVPFLSPSHWPSYYLDYPGVLRSLGDGFYEMDVKTLARMNTVSPAWYKDKSNALGWQIYTDKYKKNEPVNALTLQWRKGKFSIMDGNHRFRAAVDLDIPTITAWIGDSEEFYSSDGPDRSRLHSYVMAKRVAAKYLASFVLSFAYDTILEDRVAALWLLKHRQTQGYNF